MSFRFKKLVPKLVTLNDPGIQNGPYFAYFTEFGSFRQIPGALRKSG